MNFFIRMVPVTKFNPNHDKDGKFTTADGGMGPVTMGDLASAPVMTHDNVAAHYAVMNVLKSKISPAEFAAHYDVLNNIVVHSLVSNPGYKTETKAALIMSRLKDHYSGFKTPSKEIRKVIETKVSYKAGNKMYAAIHEALTKTEVGATPQATGAPSLVSDQATEKPKGNLPAVIITPIIDEPEPVKAVAPPPVAAPDLAGKTGPQKVTATIEGMIKDYPHLTTKAADAVKDAISSAYLSSSNGPQFERRMRKALDVIQNRGLLGTYTHIDLYNEDWQHHFANLDSVAMGGPGVAKPEGDHASPVNAAQGGHSPSGAADAPKVADPSITTTQSTASTLPPLSVVAIDEEVHNQLNNGTFQGQGTTAHEGVVSAATKAFLASNGQADDFEKKFSENITASKGEAAAKTVKGFFSLDKLHTALKEGEAQTTMTHPKSVKWDETLPLGTGPESPVLLFPPHPAEEPKPEPAPAPPKAFDPTDMHNAIVFALAASPEANMQNKAFVLKNMASEAMQGATSYVEFKRNLDKALPNDYSANGIDKINSLPWEEIYAKGTGAHVAPIAASGPTPAQIAEVTTAANAPDPEAAGALFTKGFANAGEMTNGMLHEDFKNAAKKAILTATSPDDLKAKTVENIKAGKFWKPEKIDEIAGKLPWADIHAKAGGSTQSTASQAAAVAAEYAPAPHTGKLTFDQMIDNLGWHSNSLNAANLKNAMSNAVTSTMGPTTFKDLTLQKFMALAGNGTAVAEAGAKLPWAELYDKAVDGEFDTKPFAPAPAAPVAPPSATFSAPDGTGLSHKAVVTKALTAGLASLGHGPTTNAAKMIIAAAVKAKDAKSFTAFKKAVYANVLVDLNVNASSPDQPMSKGNKKALGKFDWKGIFAQVKAGKDGLKAMISEQVMGSGLPNMYGKIGQLQQLVAAHADDATSPEDLKQKVVDEFKKTWSPSAVNNVAALPWDTIYSKATGMQSTASGSAPVASSVTPTPATPATPKHTPWVAPTGAYADALTTKGKALITAALTKAGFGKYTSGHISDAANGLKFAPNSAAFAAGMITHLDEKVAAGTISKGKADKAINELPWEKLYDEAYAQTPKTGYATPASTTSTPDYSPAPPAPSTLGTGDTSKNGSYAGFTRYDLGGETHMAMGKLMGQKKLNGSELEALTSYKQNGYKNINRELREGKSLSAVTGARVSNLFNAVMKGTVPAGTMLYRGMPNLEEIGLDSDLKGMVKAGRYYHDNGFQSSSTSRNFADNWDASGPKSVLFELKVTKPISGVHVAAGKGVSGDGEYEIVLAPQTMWKVTGVRKGTDSKQNVVTMETA